MHTHSLQGFTCMLCESQYNIEAVIWDPGTKEDLLSHPKNIHQSWDHSPPSAFLTSFPAERTHRKLAKPCPARTFSPEHFVCMSAASRFHHDSSGFRSINAGQTDLASVVCPRYKVEWLQCMVRLIGHLISQRSHKYLQRCQVNAQTLLRPEKARVWAEGDAGATAGPDHATSIVNLGPQSIWLKKLPQHAAKYQSLPNHETSSCSRYLKGKAYRNESHWESGCLREVQNGGGRGCIKMQG